MGRWVVLLLASVAVAASVGCSSLTGDHVDVYSDPVRVKTVKGIPVVVERPWLVREVTYQVEYMALLGESAKEMGTRTTTTTYTETGEKLEKMEPNLVWEWKSLGTFTGNETTREVISRKEIFTFSSSRPASGTVNFNATLDAANQYPTSFTYTAEDTTIKSIGEAVSQILEQLKGLVVAPGVPTAERVPVEVPGVGAPVQVVEVSRKVLQVHYIALDRVPDTEEGTVVFESDSEDVELPLSP